MAMAHEDKNQHPLRPTTSAPSSSPISPTFHPLTGSERFHYYLSHTFSPLAFARSAVWAGLDQAVDTPPEWHQGMKGYGRRFGAKFAQHTVKDTLQDSVAALLHEDPRYIPSGRTGIGSRTAYAVKHAFLVYRNDGTVKFADSHLIACFGAAAISRAWWPPADRTVQNTLTSGLTSWGVDAGMTVLKEFWPDIRRKIGGMFR